MLATGKALAAFLDEFHPQPIVFSAGVERLVCRLLIIEDLLHVECKDPAAFFLRRRCLSRESAGVRCRRLRSCYEGEFQ